VVLGLLVNEAPAVSPRLAHRIARLVSLAENAIMTAVPQLITLLGVIIGAFATFAVTTWTERLRWQRAIETRWDEKRFTAYAE